MATVTPDVRQIATKDDKLNTLGFRALLLFSLVYYARPEDLFTPLRVIPLSKILGGVCIIGLIAGLGKRRKMKFPLAMTFLLLLFAQMIFTIPFAYWRGGAFQMVFSYFAKGVVIAVLISLLVESLPQIRRLMFVQAAAVSFMALAALGQHNIDGGRLIGAAGGIFENSNDLAINIAVNLPLSFAFLLAARGTLRKAMWAVPVIGMLAVVTLTYSRSGFLALVVAGVVGLWEFGVKGRRFHLIFITAAAVVLMTVFAPANYSIRLESIFTGRIRGSADRGSAEARKELLRTSVHLMEQHPLVGIGPGCFPAVSDSWHVAHNTYAQMGAEAGIPALILFLLVIGAGMKNLFVAQRSALFKANNEFRILTSGLMASMAAYMMGAFFADTSYNLFPYFLVAYTCGLRHVAELWAPPPNTAPAEKPPVAPVLRSPHPGYATTSSRF